MNEDLRIRLLIVDDEQSIRKLCMTVGEALGFVCMGLQALTLLLLLGYLALALRFPGRGPHDYLAGTFLVPR